MMENQEPEQKEDNAEKWADITSQIQQATQTTHVNRKIEKKSVLEFGLGIFGGFVIRTYLSFVSKALYGMTDTGTDWTLIFPICLIPIFISFLILIFLKRWWGVVGILFGLIFYEIFSILFYDL